MNTSFEDLKSIITQRRTRKVALMNGSKVAQEKIKEIIQMADYAPTHGRTEPWRIHVFQDESLKDFCSTHAKMYWENTDESIRTQTKMELFKDMYLHASHLAIIYMKRTPNTKIPMLEEYAACCAAAQNMLLTAESLNVSAIWNSGGMTYSQQMKDFLNLKEEDQVVGLLYFGYMDKDMDKTAFRKIPIEDKVTYR